MDPEVYAIIFPIWIRAFVFTLIVEVPIFVLVARVGGGEKVCPIWRLVVGAVVGTCVTHPLLWFVWPRLIADYTTYIVTGELLVAVIESFTFFAIARPIRLSRAVAASFIANAGSYGLGALLQGLEILK